MLGRRLLSRLALVRERKRPVGIINQSVVRLVLVTLCGLDRIVNLSALFGVVFGTTKKTPLPRRQAVGSAQQRENVFLVKQIVEIKR